MHLRLILLVSASCLIGTAISATTNVGAAAAAATTAKPQGFAARSVEVDENEEDEFEPQAQTHLAYRQRPQYTDYSQEEDQEEAPRQVYQSRNVQQQQQNNYLKNNNNNKKKSSEEESEEEEEEPDRLSLLLAKSTFNCDAKNSGYYADESLNCEVFHYCQESQRHSWICPEGFTFHQIHLICMPPSNENICQQSSKYHIVNDYLYKPINLQEHQSKPNVTLRYSDRYYPESYYENDRYEDEEEAPRQRIHHHQRQPVQVGFNTQQQQQQQQQPIYQQQPQPQQQTQRQQPQQQVQRHQPVVQQTTVYRKPVPVVTTIQPQLTPQIQQHRPQTIAPSATPSPYRFYTTSPLQQLQQQQHQVYRSPEEINISLQQRRPQLFVASTTPRYYEDEYLYERRK